MLDKSLSRVLGTLYIALSSGLSREGIEAANDVLLNVADQRGTPADEAELFRIIANCSAADGLRARPRLAAVNGEAV